MSATTAAPTAAAPAGPVVGGVRRMKESLHITGSKLPSAAQIALANASLPALFIHTQESHTERYIEWLLQRPYVNGKAGILGSGEDWLLMKLPVEALPTVARAAVAAAAKAADSKTDSKSESKPTEWTLHRIFVDFSTVDGFFRNLHRISLCTTRYDSFDQLVEGFSTSDPLVSSFSRVLPPAPKEAALIAAKSTTPVQVPGVGEVCGCCDTVRIPAGERSAAQKAVSVRLQCYPQQDDAQKFAVSLCRRNIGLNPTKNSSHVLCITEVTPHIEYLKAAKEHNEKLIENILGRFAAQPVKAPPTEVMHSSSTLLSIAGRTAMPTDGMGLALPAVVDAKLSQQIVQQTAAPTTAAASSSAATSTAVAAATADGTATAPTTRTVVAKLTAEEEAAKEKKRAEKKAARASTKPALTKQQRTAMRLAEADRAIAVREERRVQYEQRLNAGTVWAGPRDGTAPTTATATSDGKASASATVTATAPSKQPDQKADSAATPAAAKAKEQGKAEGKATGKEKQKEQDKQKEQEVLAPNPNASRGVRHAEWVGWYSGVMPSQWINEMHRRRAELSSTTDVLCRARFKLDESFQRFAVPHCAKCAHATPFRLVFDDAERERLIAELRAKKIGAAEDPHAVAIAEAAEARTKGVDPALHFAHFADSTSITDLMAAKAAAKVAAAKAAAAAPASNSAATAAAAAGTFAADTQIIALPTKVKNNCSGKKKREKREKRHAAAKAKAEADAANGITSAPAPAPPAAAVAAVAAAAAIAATGIAAAAIPADSKTAASSASATAVTPAASSAAPSASAKAPCNCGCGCVNGKKLHALDLGAAPGGWTALLSERLAAYTGDERAGSVLAVDPGALHPSVSSRPNVVHYRLLLQEAMPSLLQLGGCDLVVCDMCVEPLAIFGLINQISAVMSRGAPLILTLKFHKRPSAASVKLQWDYIQNELSKHFTAFRLDWLFAGTTAERTVFAYKK